jgi:hypothetical protein
VKLPEICTALDEEAVGVDYRSEPALYEKIYPEAKKDKGWSDLVANAADWDEGKGGQRRDHRNERHLQYPLVEQIGWLIHFYSILLEMLARFVEYSPKYGGFVGCSAHRS